MPVVGSVNFTRLSTTFDVVTIFPSLSLMYHRSMNLPRIGLPVLGSVTDSVGLVNFSWPTVTVNELGLKIAFGTAPVVVFYARRV